MQEKVYSVDIETVSQGKRALDFTNSQSYPTGNAKDPAKIEAQQKTKKAEAASKHGLSWYVGKVCSIAIMDIHSDFKKVIYGFNEKDILTELSHDIRGVKLIGKNSINFDYPFLIGRYMANKIPMPPVLRNRWKLLDIDNFFGRGAMSQITRLDNYSFGIDFGEKTMHGSGVQGVYNAALAAMIDNDKEEMQKQWNILTEYNLQDTAIVKAIVLAYYGTERGEI